MNPAIDPFDRETDHWPEQIAEAEARCAEASYGVDAFGNKFRVNDTVFLADGTAVRVVGIRGARFSYWDSRVPLGLVSQLSAVVRKSGF